jgi:hypothetical protein
MWYKAMYTQSYSKFMSSEERQHQINPDELEDKYT